MRPDMPPVKTRVLATQIFISYNAPAKRKALALARGLAVDNQVSARDAA